MSHLVLLFIATYGAAFAASTLPGLLNIGAAKISAETGKKNAVIYSFGVCTVILIQALIAVYISKFLYKNPHIIDYLLKAALVIFAGVAIYYFIHAQKKRPKKKIEVKDVSKKNSFFKGMFFAVLNLLTIPFYCGLNAAWNVSGWIKFDWQDIVTFIVAGALGTFSILYVYIFYFNKLEMKTNRFSKYSDYIIGSLMLILMIITFIRIFYNS
ncbi:lysine transporter LysE [Zhouia sp. PK063]|uniref:lysine transporter LysE n=1 Tax=Zhouia sp. PK063 TaxID=3373602 RepID=UPI0037995FBB